MRKTLLSLLFSLGFVGAAFGQGAGLSLVTTPPTNSAIELQNTGSPLNVGITADDFAEWVAANLDANVAVTGTLTVTSTSASALAVGASGATNPVLKVNANTASVATGIQVTGAAAAGGVAVAAISSGTDENLTIDAKGAGTITLNGTGTGNISLARATGITGATTVTSASASSLAVGLAGATNPAFVVDSSTGSQAAGLKVTGAVAAGTVAIASISSGSDANLSINAKGTGTIAVGDVSTGAVTITPATTVTGALTPTGGVAAAGGFSVSCRMFFTGNEPAIATTSGSNLDIVTTETYRAEIFVPANCSSTGVAIFNGTAVAGNVQAYLIDSTGAQVTGVLTASTAQSGTTAYQLIPWAGGPYTIKGPATYWIAVQGDNSSGDLRTHTVGTFGADKQTGTVYGTLTVAASPTTFTTAVGPLANLY